MENFIFFEISKLTPSSLQNNINQKLYIFLIFKMIPDSRAASRRDSVFAYTHDICVWAARSSCHVSVC